MGLVFVVVFFLLPCLLIEHILGLNTVWFTLLMYLPNIDLIK